MHKKKKSKAKTTFYVILVVIRVFYNIMLHLLVTSVFRTAFLGAIPPPKLLPTHTHTALKTSPKCQSIQKKRGFFGVQSKTGFCTVVKKKILVKETPPKKRPQTIVQCSATHGNSIGCLTQKMGS